MSLSPALREKYRKTRKHLDSIPPISKIKKMGFEDMKRAMRMTQQASDHLFDGGFMRHTALQQLHSKSMQISSQFLEPMEKLPD